MMDAAYFTRARELIGESMGGFAPELVLSLLVIVLLMHDLFTRGARPERAAAIAGITNEAGNVIGLMPHPEHAVEPAIGGSDGLVLLGSMLDAVVGPTR